LNSHTSKRITVNLLLVDDHAIVTDGLQALLSDEPEFVIKGVAQNGAMAIDMLEVLKVDVVLMDIDMPEMDGVQATKIIKSKMPDKKILMLTMHDEKAMIKTLMEIGADGYLLKNSSKDELVTALRVIQSGQSYFSSDVQTILEKEEPSKSSSIDTYELTDREVEIVKLIAEGYSNKQIGEKLFISHRTVDTHRTNLMNKLNVHNVAGIVKFAITNGMLD
jgi:DNA-binding NarL/FixJ family response regulator